MVITSRQALEQSDLPSNAVVLGGGAIGVEFASVYNSYGVNVTIVEMMPQLLPNEDAEISKLLERSLRRKGINIMTGARAFAFERNGDSAVLRVETGTGEVDVPCGRVLVAIGIQGNVESLGLEAIGVTPQNSFISVDDDLATGVPGVYAIGDVTGKLPLAHAASAQGSTWRNDWPDAIHPLSTTWTCPRRHTATPRWPAWASRRSRPAPRATT